MTYTVNRGLWLRVNKGMHEWGGGGHRVNRREGKCFGAEKLFSPSAGLEKTII